jgi:L-fucose isomerase-like protein
MNNVPEIKLGIVAVSRDCFPIELSKTRKGNVVRACNRKQIPITALETVIENESDTAKALRELKDNAINALVIYLGNFGPEGPLTLLAQKFDGPVMLVAAAEEDTGVLLNDRGDAYCGMLNASYNIGLRKLNPYIPEYPVGTPDEVAAMIADFVPVARIIIGIRRLKIFTFGPRPQDFLACNAPIKPLYDLGVEIMENSELDLYDRFLATDGDPEIPAVKADMEQELGQGNRFPDLLDKLAQYEITLTRFHKEQLGLSAFGIFANKCWPSFEKYFGFVPCYVNSRLAARGIPVACEVDIYGALSEYMATCATMEPATLLDINNTVPADLFKRASAATGDYTFTDLFMGFHCGNTACSCLGGCEIKFQKIMHRLMEPGQEPNITRGTLEGTLKPGATTLFRLQSTAGAELKSYVAEGEILDIDPHSFGSIGVFAIREMARFYRHVLIQKRFPHHAGIAFSHAGKSLFAAIKMLGVEDVSFNQPATMLYGSENPF